MPFAGGDDAFHVLHQAVPALNGGRREVAFIDTGVVDWGTLADGVAPGVEVVLLDSSRDGLAQMAAWAAGKDGYDAIHLLSHGAEGRVLLGALSLDVERAIAREPELAKLGSALTAGGDLLLYGCNVAHGSGNRFLSTLAELVGADIAASVGPTGADALGGNWLLEARVGDVGTPVAITAAAQDRFAAILAPTTFTLTTDDTDTVTGAATETFSENGYELTFTLEQYTDISGVTLGYFGGYPANYSIYDGTSQGGADTLEITVSMTGYTFDLNSITLYDISTGQENPATYTLTTNKGGVKTGSISNEIDGVHNVTENSFGDADQFLQISSFSIVFSEDFTDADSSPWYSLADLILDRITAAAPTVTLTSSGSSLAENGGVATVTATLSRTATTDTMVTLTTAGTATGGGTDYTLSATTLTIAAGQTSATATVTGVDDAVNDEAETVVVDIDGVSGGDGAAESSTPQSTTLTITDDDPAPTVTLTSSGSPLAENGGVATITATLSAAATTATTVTLSFGGTASGTAPVDFTLSGAMITIAAGQTVGTITATGVNDAFNDEAETIVVDISGVSGGDGAAESGTPQSVTLTITDDDDPPTVTLTSSGSPLAENGGMATVTATLSAAATTATTVTLSTAGTATGGGTDYSLSAATLTIAAGQTSATATVTGVDDATTEGLETVIVDIDGVSGGDGAAESGTPQSTTLTIADDDAPTVTLTSSGSPLAENGGVATVTATLSAAVATDTMVTLTTAGTATNATDYTLSATTLTIAAGQTSATATVTGVDDAVNDEAETVVVDIDGVSGGDGAAESSTPQSTTLTITDDDPAPTVTLTSSGSPLAENGGVATITATLSAAATTATTVTLSFGGTASGTAPVDFTLSGAMITIAAGQTVGTITATGVNDAFNDEAETIVVDISGVSGGDGAAESGTPQSVTLTITDDDDPPTVTLTSSGSPLAENGGMATVTATLSAAATTATTVTLSTAGTATGGGTDYSLSAATLTIAAGQTSATATVTGVDDATTEGLETVIVDIDGVSGGDGAAESGTPQSTTLTIADDDAPTVTLTSSGSPLAENGGVATVTATLSAAAATDTMVTLTTAGTATGGGTDYSLSATTLTIAAGQTVATATVTGVDDAFNDEAETVVVDISGVSGGDGAAESGTPQSATLTITDDDPAPTVTLTSSGSSLAENGGVATVTATLSAATATDTMVTLTTAGTATNATDYTLSATTLTIAAGQTIGTVTATGVDDGLVDAAETVVVDISAVSGGDGAAESGTPQSTTLTITDDDVAPAVSSVSASTADGSYNAGDTVVVTVAFTKTVAVTGTPTLTLETGATDRTATYSGGTGTTTLSFTYTVQAGDSTSDLDYLSTSALALTGGATIQDAAGNDAVLALPSPGAPGSLAANKGIVIDTTAPTLSALSPLDDATGVGASADLTLTFSETVARGTGAITLYTAGDVPVETFDVATSNRLTVTDSSVTIDPTASLEYSSGYYVTVASGAIQDAAGNGYAGITDKTVFNFTTGAAPPPPDTGSGGGTTTPPTTRTVDGVVVQTQTETTPDGTQTEVITVPVVTDTRTEEDATTTNADIPLLTDTVTGTRRLEASVPIGVGLRVETVASMPAGTETGLTGLIRAIRSRTQDQPADQSEMTGVGATFLESLPTGEENLIVRTIVPTTTLTTAPSTPLVITGDRSTGPDRKPVALVIDVSALPPGTVIQLQDVEFAAVVGAVQVTGGAGSQVVTGDRAAQYIVLGADDDTLRGGGGNDFVGSAEGNDVLFGDEGDDTVTGGLENDALYGNKQNDLLYGNFGTDTLFGGQDNDTALGGLDDDLVYGQLGSDVLYGNRGADTLFGGQEGDTLFGGQDGDLLYGNLGDDWLDGNLGADTLFGGQGADLFVFRKPEEGGDAIADFEAGVDRIAVYSPNFGNLAAGTLSAANFALDDPANGNAVFVFNTTTGVLSFDSDGNGAGVAVTIATLNVRTLSHTDITVLAG
ncbi:Calx-beta domain-containing protein [Azospirillum sp. ST 5-10]|uniref:Calx-beta domain-containing protein n=2 Tax=unclassified Azospirillum TaxID=2630922 RepID=UPI003F4A111D